ncbi:MAG: hypothetical protein SFZ24_09545 [Planctomycetota bacterium]|nr:hypothetical protein [Planctomycetota bacterium]
MSALHSRVTAAQRPTLSRPTRRSLSTLLALPLALTGAAGCGETRMIMDGTMRLEGPIQMQTSFTGPSVSYNGTYISDALLERVEPGTTRADWILAVFGEPDQRAMLTDGTEIWKWTYRPSSQELSMVSLFGNSEDKPASAARNVFVHLAENTVLEAWHD